MLKEQGVVKNLQLFREAELTKELENTYTFDKQPGSGYPNSITLNFDL